MSMSLQQARVIDPVLTEHSRGFKHAEHVGSLLFPRVPVGTRGGKVIEFGRESFMLYNARRAPGADVKRISFGYEGKPYYLTQDALEGKVPIEYQQEALKVPKIDLGLRTINVVMRSLTLTLEAEQAAMATNIANYRATNTLRLSGTSQWSHPSSDPFVNIQDARQTLRRACGVYPNVAIAGPLVYDFLKRHPAIRNQFRNTDILTGEMLAKLFEIDILAEGRAVVADGTSGQFSDVWGNYFIMAYVPQNPVGQEEPSFGYTYTLNNDPSAETPYYAGGTRSWIYPVVYERSPVLTGMDAGFLFTNVVFQ